MFLVRFRELTGSIQKGLFDVAVSCGAEIKRRVTAMLAPGYSEITVMGAATKSSANSAKESSSTFVSRASAPATGSVAPAPKKARIAEAEVDQQDLSTEFTISRPTTILSSEEKDEITKIFTLHPQLVHECVPSRKRAVFLMASSVNSSKMPLLVGDASVYLNSNFIAKVGLNHVSPGERFRCSLGIDPTVPVDYAPARKYTQRDGRQNTMSKTSMSETPVLPQSFWLSGRTFLVARPPTLRRNPPLVSNINCLDENTQSRQFCFEEPEKNMDSDQPAPKEGCVLTTENNLDWTVRASVVDMLKALFGLMTEEILRFTKFNIKRLDAGAVQNLKVEYVLEHPKEGRLEFEKKRHRVLVVLLIFIFSSFYLPHFDHPSLIKFL